jgi:arylsulfatase A-like enzyme
MEQYMKQPNILLIISDQHRADTMGFRGIVSCNTPNMDRLAEEGVSFDKAVTPCPLCGPARASIFTGKYSHQVKGVLLEDNLGVRSNDNLVEIEETDMMINDSSLREKPELTNLLKKSGYFTAYAGKWHLGNDIIHNWFDRAEGYSNETYIQWAEDNGLENAWPLKDFEVRSKRTPHMSIPKTKVSPITPEVGNDAWIADIALRFLEEKPADKPFFLTCAFNGPHPPFKISEPYYSMYDADSIDEPINFKPGADEPECKSESFYRALWQDHGDDWDRWKKTAAVYRGFVTYIDDQIGRIIAELEKKGLKEDTFIIYCSDHGEMLGQHGLWHKMQPYEEALRVPLIISAPWMKGSLRSDELASLIDIPSTILSAAGISPPADYEGSDLLKVFENGRIENREYIFSQQKPLGEFHKEVDWRMITDKRYKFVWNRNDAEELYDLEIDPNELINQAKNRSYGEIRAVLHKELISWMAFTNDPLFILGSDPRP